MPPDAPTVGMSLLGSNVQPPVFAVDPGKCLAHGYRAEGVCVGIRLTQILGQNLRVVDPFLLTQVRKVAFLMLQKASGIGDFRVRDSLHLSGVL